MVTKEMPKYQSHKKVWALKIKKIDFSDDVSNDFHAIITPEEEGYEPFVVNHEYIHKHKPQAGGYYVVYEDGYRSWSPSEAFEEGYSKIN